MSKFNINISGQIFRLNVGIDISLSALRFFLVILIPISLIVLLKFPPGNEVIFPINPSVSHQI